MKDVEEASLHTEKMKVMVGKSASPCLCIRSAKIAVRSLPVRDAASELLSRSCFTFTFLLGFQKLDS